MIRSGTDKWTVNERAVFGSESKEVEMASTSLETALQSLVTFLRSSAADGDLITVHVKSLLQKLEALPKLSFEEATTLASISKGAQDVLGEAHVKAIVDGIHSKVRDMPLEARSKRPMQDWQAWPNFLTKGLWQEIMTQTNSSTVLRSLLLHLHALAR